MVFNHMTGFWRECRPLSMFLYYTKHFSSIGPNVLSLGSLNPDGTSVIPTVTDNLFNQKIIQNDIVGISLEPTTSASEMNGALMFGSIDNTRIIENPNSL